MSKAKTVLKSLRIRCDFEELAVKVVASPVAAREPQLARLLSLLYDDDGNVASDLLPLLPSEWEDIKESKAARLQISPVEVYSILPNITTTPCLAPKGGHELDRALTRLKAHEPIWERITTYFRRSLFHELKSTAVALGIELKGDASIEYSSSGNFRLNESTMVLSLLQLNVLESRTSFSFGLKSMEMSTRVKLLEFVAPFIRKMKVCMMQVYNNADNATESAKECRQIFKDHYNVLVDAQTVYTFGQSISSVVQDYTTNVMKIVVAIQRFAFTSRLKILDWHDHQFEIRQFNTLYREGGNDNIEVHELMKVRKLMVSEIVNYIRPLTDHLENGLRARENVLQRLGVEHPPHPSLAVINETNSCLLKLARDVPLLKKSVFIRGEWLNRVQRQVEIVRSHSATPQYDQVNLLLVKLYFSHFKQEKIVQERSYNVFLLLGILFFATIRNKFRNHLMTEIGGTIGLYVGATLLTVAETVVFFFEGKARKVHVKTDEL
ncbi:unnamed protein product [Nippostrongylus brasiliensis]|uniref:Ion_trans domain-containing protein n=1 Tax=Nippostrongylus brasiliensis TaxID=27835 RepID=A0A158R3N0_NIPBR|nr:unnamed protein product [Nippostrongylus brasiliensis]